MSIEEIMSQMGTKRQEIGQRYAALPNQEANVRESLFGGDKTLGSLRDNEAGKIKELYEADKGLATAYQGGPAGFIDDPASVARYGHQNLGARAGELADIQKGVANRRDVLGDALEKSMKMLQYGLEALNLEYSGLQDEFDNRVKLEELDLKKKEKGGTNVLPNLLQQIMAFQQKGQDVAPKTTGRTKTKADRGTDEYNNMMSRLKQQFPGAAFELSQNKDKTWNYAIRKPDQQFLTPEEAPLYDDPRGTINKMAAAGVASGASTGDISSIMELLFPSAPTQTRGEQQDSAITELAGDLQMVPPGANAQSEYLKFRAAYPEVADDTLKSMMRSVGLSIY